MGFVWTIVSILLATVGGATVIFSALTLGIGAEAWYYQVRLRTGLEHDLGFTEGTAILPGVGLHGYVSAVAIVSVTEGGVFDRAGFHAGDALPDESHTSFFKKLHRHRNGTLTLAVVDGGAGPAFDERPRRMIQFFVPPRSP
jgi:hypothetical protein